MKKMLAILLLSLSTLASANYSSENFNNNLIKPRIVGGKEVNPAETDISFIVHFKGGCAGSIISDRWLLTAAHCSSLFKRNISGGGYDLNAPGRVTLRIKDFYIHEKYNNTNHSHDVALIELLEPIDFEATGLSPIDIVGSDFEDQGYLSEGTMLTVYGWGAQHESGYPIPSRMREVDVPVVSREVANDRKAYNGKIDLSMITAGYSEGGKDACQGDSGGPIVLKDGPNGNRVLVGVVSWGHGCARANKYGVYSNVSYLSNWIVNTILAHQ